MSATAQFSRAIASTLDYFILQSRLEMKIDHRYTAILAAIILVSGLTACNKPGPAETAGKKIDEATENVSKSINDTVNQAEKAIKN